MLEPIRVEWPSFPCCFCAKSNWMSNCIQKKEQRRGKDCDPRTDAYWMTFTLLMFLSKWISYCIQKEKEEKTARSLCRWVLNGVCSLDVPVQENKQPHASLFTPRPCCLREKNENKHCRAKHRHGYSQEGWQKHWQLCCAAVDLMCPDAVLCLFPGVGTQRFSKTHTYLSTFWLQCMNQWHPLLRSWNTSDSWMLLHFITEQVVSGFNVFGSFVGGCVAYI